jgi:hypothetical protein
MSFVLRERCRVSAIGRVLSLSTVCHECDRRTGSHLTCHFEPDNSQSVGVCETNKRRLRNENAASPRGEGGLGCSA